VGAGAVGVEQGRGLAIDERDPALHEPGRGRSRALPLARADGDVGRLRVGREGARSRREAVEREGVRPPTLRDEDAPAGLDRHRLGQRRVAQQRRDPLQAGGDGTRGGAGGEDLERCAGGGAP
jgi:hypothetical protein